MNSIHHGIVLNLTLKIKYIRQYQLKNRMVEHEMLKDKTIISIPKCINASINQKVDMSEWLRRQT